MSPSHCNSPTLTHHWRSSYRHVPSPISIVTSGDETFCWPLVTSNHSDHRVFYLRDFALFSVNPWKRFLVRIPVDHAKSSDSFSKTMRLRIQSTSCYNQSQYGRERKEHWKIFRGHFFGPKALSYTSTHTLTPPLWLVASKLQQRRCASHLLCLLLK